MNRLLPVGGCAALFLFASQAIADDATDFAWHMSPGAQMPMQTILRDEAGHDIRFGDLFGAQPVILDFGYFHCPSLCGTVRADLLAALKQSGLSTEHDYSFVSVSIDPSETPVDAAKAKAADAAEFSTVPTADWHYLTGNAGALMAAAGFRDRYDAAFRQFLHPAGLVVLTRQGRISSYLLGVGISGGDLRAAVLRAGNGTIASLALPILLLCFHFDSTTGRYTLAIMKTLRLMALLTVATIGGLLLVLHRFRAKGAA